jgi:hypothetical protein
MDFRKAPVITGWRVLSFVRCFAVVRAWQGARAESGKMGILLNERRSKKVEIPPELLSLDPVDAPRMTSAPSAGR